MAETVGVRAGDFFKLDEHSTIEINGGYPPVYVLEEMLDSLESDPPSLETDTSVGEGLLELVYNELVGYGTDGSNELDDKESGTIWGRLRSERYGIRAWPKPGYQRRKSSASWSLRTRVRIWSRRWAPRGVQRICCFLTIRLAMTCLTADSVNAVEMASPRAGVPRSWGSARRWRGCSYRTREPP